MDQIGWIRRLKGREGKSEREIARMTGLSRNTVAKWLRADVQPPKYRRPVVCPGRCKSEPPCRPNSEPGMEAGSESSPAVDEFMLTA